MIEEREVNPTYSHLGLVFKQSPAVVVNAVVLQDKQLTDVPGGDVTGNLHGSAGVVFTIDFNYLWTQAHICSSWNGSGNNAVSGASVTSTTETFIASTLQKKYENI